MVSSLSTETVSNLSFIGSPMTNTVPDIEFKNYIKQVNCIFTYLSIPLDYKLSKDKVYAIHFYISVT